MKYIFLVAFIFSSHALSSDWSGVMDVGEINAGYKGGMVLFSGSVTYNPATCNVGQYAMHPDYTEVKDALSLIMIAKASNKKIRVAVSQTECGAWNYPKVLRVKLI